MYNHRFSKIDFSEIIAPNEKREWCYSSEELQSELNDICQNHILKKVYVALQGYLESLHQDKNHYDFSYFGGPVFLFFDNIAIEIFVHIMGMVQYRVINLWDIKIENRRDFPPDDMGLKGDNYFYDLSKQFELLYEEQKVISVLVDKTNCYPFSLEGFDEQKAKVAEEKNNLPNDIHFRLENGVDFGIYADGMGYYFIELKK